MREVVFVDGCRSAFGKQGGSLSSMAGSEIAGEVIKGLLERTQIMERGGVDSVFAGCALKDSVAVGPARYAALLAGLPYEIPATFIEMQCGSAITAINAAACKILAGLSDVMIVGGMESWSRRVALFSMCQEPFKLIPPTAIPERLAPLDEENISMLQVSDGMAKKWGISREQCDEYALNSQLRLAEAYKKGITGDEIIPIKFAATRKTPEIVVDKDEFPRPGTTLEGLGKLRAVLGPDGFTTAGNASGMNDGAAFVLMMTAEKAKELGYEPIARWVTGSDVGVQPSVMGIGPAYSNLKALKQAGLTIDDLDVFECNEAFAAQNLSVIKEMESLSGKTIDMAKWNPNGGAIAIGHPNGASGARVGMFAMRQLELTGGKYGLFSSCCGGGHGTTTVIENLRR